MKKKETLEERVKRIHAGIVKEESSNTSFYRSELSKINPASEYGVTILLSDGDGAKTKYMRLNAESIPLIIQFLKTIK